MIVKPYMGKNIMRAMYGSIKTSFGLLLDSLLVISFKSRLSESQCFIDLTALLALLF